MEEAEKLKNKLKKSQFDFNDFLAQLRQLSRLGGMEGMLKFLPGGRQMREAIGSLDERYLSRMEAIVLSMTPAEREDPDLIDFSRRKRIARGSGTRVEDVSGLVKQFIQMRKMLKKSGLLSRLFAGGGDIPAATLPAGAQGNAMNALTALAPAQGMSKKEQEKKKRLAKLQKKERQKQRRKKH
jgi:signal recognition particle subunit SRP54